MFAYIKSASLFLMCLTMCCVWPSHTRMASAASAYSHISNGPAPAGPNASLEEVWWRHGGARLQYDALIGSMQTNSNGKPWRDPATIHNIPSLYPNQAIPKRPKGTSHAPSSRIVLPTPAATTVQPTPSHKPTVPTTNSTLSIQQAPKGS